MDNERQRWTEQDSPVRHDRTGQNRTIFPRSGSTQLLLVHPPALHPPKKIRGGLKIAVVAGLRGSSRKAKIASEATPPIAFPEKMTV